MRSCRNEISDTEGSMVDATLAAAGYYVTIIE
jgi:hypothetical protein